MRALTIAIRLVSLLAFSLPSLAAGPIVEGELGQKLDESMTQAAADGFSGVLLVAKDGKVMISKGYGQANLKEKRPYTSETVFDIGSITKQFTAAAIMHLEMNGKLSVDDTLTKYFDNVPDDKRTITLHHLLTHSAGLTDTVGGDYEVAPRDETVRRILATKLLTPPGERYRYSNAGYSALGAVVEIASGQPYERYLHENLFLPAGMRQTGYRLPDWNQAVVACGVLALGLDWGSPLEKRWADDGPYWNLRANGGILSTVGDMYRWHLALEGDEVLSNEAKTKIFAPHVPEGPRARTHYGYGWSIATTPRGTKLVQHNGSNGIFYAVFKRYVAEDTVIIMASNDARRMARRHEGKIVQIVFPSAIAE